MKIRTDQPLINNPIKITTIARFWDQISDGWRKVWGPHIHHGFYENNDALTPLQAQEKLIEKLAGMLEIKPNDYILDVGCGMGGSSLFLANKFDVKVQGITLSPRQVAIATAQAQIEKNENVAFKVENALSMLSLADNSFDIVWSLESCEQFYDKDLFIKQAMRVLKPGGQLLLATWCSSEEEYSGVFAKKYRKLCLAFDLPYMPTIENYSQLIKKNNFNLKATFDWSSQVKKSWDIGVTLASTYSFLQLLKMSGWRGWRFAKQIKLMRDGFNFNRVKYGVFLATKPQ